MILEFPISGVIRTLHEMGKLDHAFCTETRPYNQGARLTAYELVHDKIPATLICDSMVSMVLRDKGVSAIIVGADRVTKNGDTANKIGTYQLAISAKYHGVPFYSACPVTTFDPNLNSGKDIVIEERPGVEMTHVKGVEIAAPGMFCLVWLNIAVNTFSITFVLYMPPLPIYSYLTPKTLAYGHCMMEVTIKSIVLYTASQQLWAFLILIWAQLFKINDIVSSRFIKISKMNITNTLLFFVDKM